MDELIELKGIYKRFFEGKENESVVLRDVDLSVKKGELVAIVGASGSGKSTLMNIIGALDKPSEGTYRLNGVDVVSADDNQLSHIRNQKIGFVFQTYNLIPRMSSIKNVEVPMIYAGIDPGEREEIAKKALAMVEMDSKLDHTPDELSGGQKQRVAIARALVNDPDIILADEPTGALDTVTGRLIMDIFHRLHKEKGITIILITHSPELAEECERVLTISDGRITGERRGSAYAEG